MAVAASNRVARSEWKKAGGIKLSIGSLSRETGIPVETIRAWESRYGFPKPLRKPSGHRVYDPATVDRLIKIRHILRQGYRAAEVVPASPYQLNRLIQESDSASIPTWEAASQDDYLQMIREYDATGLTLSLLRVWGHTEPLSFLEDHVAPLLVAVGDGWASGRLSVAHEHFVSEKLEDLLKSLRMPFDQRARGPVMALATLPGENHALGLHMAAMVASSCGWKVRCFGRDLPLREMQAVARELKPRALGLSISNAATPERSRSAVLRMRHMLPDGIALVVGGAGAPALPESATMARMNDLRSFEAWLRGHDRAGGDR